MSKVKIPVLTYLDITHKFHPRNGGRQIQFEQKFNCTVVGGGLSITDDIQIWFETEQEAMMFVLRYL